MSSFNVAKGAAGFLAEAGRQQENAANYELHLEEKRLEEARDNRRLEAQFAKQQALSKYNFDMQSTDEETKYQRRKEEDEITYGRRRQEGKEDFQMKLDAENAKPGEFGKFVGDLKGAVKRGDLTEDQAAGILNAKTKGEKSDMRGEVGKKFDDLSRIYGPEKAAQMIEESVGKKEVTEYQRVQANDKIQDIIDKNMGAVDDRNAAQVNSMLRSIGEPVYERVVDKPEEKNQFFSDKPATYKWIPGTRKEKPEGGGASTGKNNNVGNMRPGGSSTGFQQFGSIEESIGAIDKQLKIYGDRDKVNTLRGVISKWSPPSENETDSLVANAAKITGIKPDDKIDLSNPAVRTMITAAIIRQEGNPAFLEGIGKGGGAKKPTASEQQPAGIMAGGDQAQQPEQPPAATGEEKPADPKTFDLALRANKQKSEPFEANVDIGVPTTDDNPDQSQTDTRTTGKRIGDALGAGAETLQRGKNAVTGAIQDKVEKVGDGLLAARDFGESFGTADRWKKVFGGLSDAAQASLAAMKANGLSESQIVEAAQKQNLGIEEFLVQMSEGYAEGKKRTKS
jgi:hypothetical protein